MNSTEISEYLNTTVSTVVTYTESHGQPGINSFTCFLLAFTLGGLAAVIAKTLSAPIERIKLIQQCLYRSENDIESSDDLLDEKNEKRDLQFGFFSCGKYIYRNEGFLAFWRGNFANCLRYVPKFSFDMAFKEDLKHLFKKWIQPGDNTGLKFLTKWFSGLTASFLSTLICYPLDFVRTLLAVDMGKDKEEKQYKGIWHCLKKTIKDGGIFAIYSGLMATVFGDVFYRGTKYGLYDAFKGPSKDLFLGEDNDSAVLQFFYYFLFGWFISAIARTVAYPMDTVRRSMMLDANRDAKQYKNMFDCFKQLFAQGGITRFWRGNASNIAGAWASGLVLSLYDLFKRNSELMQQCEEMKS